MKRALKYSIGCSGFHYKEWKGTFYPEKLAQKNWFAYYCEHFNTLELNVTFYRFPQIKMLKDWHEKSPKDFLFSVKAPRLITHYKNFLDCEKLLSDFYGTIKEGLQTKLGAVLFQLPAKICYSEEMLKRIVDSADKSFTNVIEFRNESWWNDEVFATIKKHRICFCSMSISKLPDNIVSGQRCAYYRFHGVPQLYKSSYSHEQLKAIADQLIADEKIKHAFIYFNNTASMAAIENAKFLQKYFDEQLQHSI